MEHLSDTERPAKRIKSSGTFRQQIVDVTISPPDDTLILPRSWSPASVLHSSCTSTETTALDRSTSPGSSPGDLNLLSSAQPFASAVSQNMDVAAPSSLSPECASVVGAITPTREYQDFRYMGQSESPPAWLPNTDKKHPTPSSQEATSAVGMQVNHLSNGSMLRTPFRDCLGTYGNFKLHTFHKPDDGYIDSYIKVKWSRRQQQLSYKTPMLQSGPLLLTSSRVLSIFDHDRAVVTLFNAGENEAIASPLGAPRLLPAHFGQLAKMEPRERRLWDFYIKNWCPGRSILAKSNIWLNEFGRMQQLDGVRAAIQCLAATYIYDYAPTPDVAGQVNRLFALAESRLTELLNYFARMETLNESDSNELVAIASMLSMQDIVVFERRMKKGRHARWWVGFSQAAQCLKALDTGERYWKRTNMQISALRIAQSIVVCRAIILSQPMMELTKPEDFVPVKEAERYEWLLDDTTEGMVEIQGGCGFSKKLLLVFNHITYLAALMQQEPRSFLTPMTIQHELQKLQRMKQWSQETGDWKHANELPQPIVQIREAPSNSRIGDYQQMTIVTAECWRIAAIVYLQCRAQRLPRNHKEVIANLDDLLSCIRIMPTSGSNFTAQAPLFPVFLLGVLASERRHKEIARNWFEKVIRTPVRSSVPPLYEVLKRVWGWIDNDIPINNEEVPAAISDRSPWWEKLVARVREEEQETLCLT